MKDEVDHHGRDIAGKRVGPSTSEFCIWRTVSPPKGERAKIWQVPLEETMAIH
jgi:hypothetical protein